MTIPFKINTYIEELKFI